MALSRQENPQLFDALRKELLNLYAKKSTAEYVKLMSNPGASLTDEQLLQIKSLDLSKYTVNSLKGIGQLKNLEMLYIDGMGLEDYENRALSVLSMSTNADRSSYGYSLNEKVFNNQY